MKIQTSSFSNHTPISQGQSCDWCDSTDPTKSHKAEYITDGTDRWWQSPPLSRDLKYSQVNLTLELGQVRSIRDLATLSLLFGRMVEP